MIFASFVHDCVYDLCMVGAWCVYDFVYVFLYDLYMIAVWFAFAWCMLCVTCACVVAWSVYDLCMICVCCCVLLLYGLFMTFVCCLLYVRNMCVCFVYDGVWLTFQFRMFVVYDLLYELVWLVYVCFMIRVCCVYGWCASLWMMLLCDLCMCCVWCVNDLSIICVCLSYDVHMMCIWLAYSFCCE